MIIRMQAGQAVRYSARVVGLLLCVWVLALLSVMAQPLSFLKIVSVSYDRQAHALNLNTDGAQTFNPAYQSVRLGQPDRLIVDIPNAKLDHIPKRLTIRQDGIDRIEFAESDSQYYQAVRMTVFADTMNALDGVRMFADGNQFRVITGVSPVTTPQWFKPPVPGKVSPVISPVLSTAGKAVVTSLTFRDGTVWLSATEQSRLRVKKQSSLSQPDRQVIDIGGAVLADKSLTRPLDIFEDSLKTVRLGQFDEDTVRLVIETTEPGALMLRYPSDKPNQLAVSTHLTPSVKTLPGSLQTVGVVENVQIFRKDTQILIRVSATAPMARKTIRRGDTLELSLLNASATPAWVSFDPADFPEIKDIRLEPLSPEEPTAKLTVRLNNPQLDVDSQLSGDGKTLEILIGSPGASWNLPNNIVLDPIGPVKRGKYTVVVDAGHGGKDLGANRGTVYEKNLNLSVVFKLKKALEAKGVTVYLTRDSDVFLPLPTICAITNKVKPDAFVSVHTNASVNTATNGIETYFYTPQSRPMADKIHRRAVNMISSPDRGVRKAMFYVIHHTSVPAVLFEMGYISHAGERETIQTEARQSATAEAIAQGVVEFLTKAQP